MNITFDNAFTPCCENMMLDGYDEDGHWCKTCNHSFERFYFSNLTKKENPKKENSKKITKNFVPPINDDYIENYVEPIYPITKVEYFDEDNLKHLLNDTRFNKSDRKRLTEYNKHRQSGGQILVQYKLAKGCEEHNLGRLFPNDGLGLQSYRFDMRNPLTKKNYWDTDMENAHYCIAERWCDKYDLPCSKITEYINNRNECLKKVCDNRKKAKTEFLKILYGGNIKLYNEDYDDVDGDLKSEGIQFLYALKSQVQALSDKIWEQHPHLHKLKCGSDKIPMNKKPNPKASLMSLIFQTDERKILMFYDYLLKVQFNRNMGVFIHDGGLVEKLDNGETQFPTEILDACSKICTQKFKIRCNFTQKNIEHDWQPLNPKLTEYETRKKEFEKKNFFVGSQFIHIQDDGVIEHVKTSDMKVRMRCNNYYEYDAEKDKNIKKYFFEEWLDDPNRANYERIDFIPDLNMCPPNVFNLFKGFNAEKFNPNKTLSKLEIFTLISPIVKHFDYLTSGYQRWILKWLAKIVQDPIHKSEIGVLIRDEGGLLTEGGGTGKNLLFEWIGSEIIGDDYFYIVGDNREMYGSFNSQFEGKLFVMVEEASSKENHTNNDILKSKITSKKQNVNKKMIAQYTVRDFTNYLFCSNNRNPLPVKQGNRRLAVFDTNTEMRGNEFYFKSLAYHLKNPIVKWAFYQYLKNLQTYETPIDFQNSIPITNAYKDVRILNSPLYLKWIVHELKRGFLVDDSMRNLYLRFKDWLKCNKEGSEDNAISETAFSLMLNKSKDAGSIDNELNLGCKSKNSVMVFKWNIPNVIDGLKKLHLLDSQFEYIECIENCDNDDDTECL